MDDQLRQNLIGSLISLENDINGWIGGYAPHNHHSMKLVVMDLQNYLSHLNTTMAARRILLKGGSFSLDIDAPVACAKSVEDSTIKIFFAGKNEPITLEYDDQKDYDADVASLKTYSL